MNNPSGLAWAAYLPGLALPLALVACGGSTPMLSGTAATGAPVVGGTVSVKCVGGPAQTATTASTGIWQVAMAGQTLPCKVKVSGGNLGVGKALHSMAVDLGNVNITPVTDLVVASVVAKAPSAWFEDDSPAEFQKITTSAVDTALGKVREALPLSPLAAANPLTTGFKAEKGDAQDNVLEAIKAAFPDYGALLTAAQGAGLKTYASEYASALNSAFASAAAPSVSSTAGSGGASTVTPPSALIGTKTLVFQNAQAGSPYANGSFISFAFSGSGMLFYGELGATTSDQIARFTRAASGEYVWYDAVKQRAFTVSVNADGSFNDMKVSGSATGTPAYGQFVTPAPGTLPSDGSGTSKVTLRFTTVGQNGSYSSTITNVAVPTSKTQFCDELVNTSISKVSLAKGLSTQGTFIVTKCDFSGNVGQVEFNWTSPAITNPIFQTVTYTYE
jgi:hypothetical protein